MFNSVDNEEKDNKHYLIARLEKFESFPLRLKLNIYYYFDICIQFIKIC